MKCIYIDADSCNVKTRTIIFNFAILNSCCKIVMVSDRKILIHTDYKILQVASDTHTRLQKIVVPQSENASDTYILAHICAGDALFTRDLQLAKQALIKKVFVISDYAEEYSLDNIDARIIRSHTQAYIRTIAAVQNGISLDKKTKKSKDKQNRKRSQEIANFLQKWIKHKER